MPFKRHILILPFLLLALGMGAETVKLPESVLSFENTTVPVVCKGGKVTLSGKHFKYGKNSLLWSWKRRGASLEIPGEIPYLHENPDPKETSVSSFVFWIYSEAPMNGRMRFAFYKGDRLCCHFDYLMNFTGWRGAWVAFDRDMQGKPEEGMDRVVITAPEGVRKGSVYFDGLITASFQDVRHHTPDWQAPFINENTTSHWLVLNNSWKLELDVPQVEITEANVSEMALIRDRFVELVAGGRRAKGYDELRKIYDSYGISYNEDGSIRGKPIFFTRYGETFINLGLKDASKKWAANGQLLRGANDFLFQLALAYANETDEDLRREYASMYVDVTRHLMDQGFVAGSGQGTLHHLGYSMRNFYTAPVIMRNVLKDAGMAEEMQKAMEWFSGVGEVKVAPEEAGMDIDAFNTSLMGRVASLLMLEDSPYKYAYLKALSRWVDNGFKYTEGLRACFKRDGTVVHHRKAYPAYATGGMDGAVKAVWMLAGTSMAISQESHEILKNALLEMRFYCNERSFPLAMSGRHPDGKDGLIPSQYALLADAGSPDGIQKIDSELASAYLRLNGEKGAWAKKFTKAGFVAEASPTGSRYYPFACVLTHRCDDWSVTLAGHSRYLWAAETYLGANLYGRYMTHGSMQIIADGSPRISVPGSGYCVSGYDWRHIPGTTAAVIPMEEMKSEVLNVDEFSGYEEMLLSDEWFAGGLSHQDKSGLFAMKLHEHDKYNGTLRARKSFFCDGNRIVALGSDICNAIDAEVHTTLFQNYYPDSNAEKIETFDDGVILSDHFGHAYFVSGGRVRMRTGLQYSFHEETGAPTSAPFETAYIVHGTMIDDGSYEYMTVVRPEGTQIEDYSEKLPYELLQKDAHAHVVRFDNGFTGYAVFEEGTLPGPVTFASPCLAACSIDAEGNMTLSVVNPDLALYRGESDEVFDAAGKRVERSVYGRKWIDSPCLETSVHLVLDGGWALEGSDENFELKLDGGKTYIKLSCREALGEETKLRKL